GPFGRSLVRGRRAGLPRCHPAARYQRPAHGESVSPPPAWHPDANRRSLTAAKPAATPMTATDIDVSALFDAQRARQPAVRALGAEQRIARIRRLREALLARREAFYDALAADFGKPPTEVDFADLAPVVAEAKHAEANLRAWMRPQR